jgi:hypothetical protein
MDVKNEMTKATKGGIHNATSMPAVSKNMALPVLMLWINFISMKLKKNVSIKLSYEVSCVNEFERHYHLLTKKKNVYIGFSKSILDQSDHYTQEGWKQSRKETKIFF